MDTTLDAFLGQRLLLEQPTHGYRAGLDAVLLAAATPVRPTQAEAVLDIGAGVGTVGLCIAARCPLATVTLWEAQPALAGLAAENIRRNQLDPRVRVVTADVHDRSAHLRSLGILADAYDHVVCNPPFDITGHGRPSANALKAASHAMAADGLTQWLRVLARTCKPGGTLTLIHRADALARLLAAAEGRFGALRILTLHPRTGEPANRIILQGIKGSRAPLTVLAGLVLHAGDRHGGDKRGGDNEGGNNGGEGRGFTPQLQAILRDGAPLELGRS
jgi:tRNA1(Val) A37 N6-methylase TrmN6